MSRGGRSRRSVSRRLALDVLYEHEITGVSVEDVLGRHGGEKALEFAAELVASVSGKAASLDEVIGRYALDWRPERMPVIDRILMRIGVFEILYRPEVPAAVIINEAVELAKTYSTEDSGRFVNGVLQKVCDELRPSDSS